VDSERLKRLILFPLAALYCALLLVAAWPRQLQIGQAGGSLQLAATYVFSRLGWPAGLGVFTGQGEHPEATLRNCFRIAAITKSRERHVLYDTMDRCRSGTREVFKDALVGFQDRRLREAFVHLQTPGAHGDRNGYPLNLLFGIADYYCHRDGVDYDHLIFTGRYQEIVLATGAERDELVVEGAHHCADGRWEMIRARQPLEGRGQP
jgi:hypothetical protein